MRVQVNGDAVEIEDGANLERLLEALKVRRDQVAVELNSVVVRRALHAQTPLHAGDQIEVVTFVGGG